MLDFCALGLASLSRECSGVQLLLGIEHYYLQGWHNVAAGGDW
jgi:hypothetical protein